MKKVSTS